MNYIARVPVSGQLGPYRVHQQVFKVAGPDARYARFSTYALVVSPQVPDIEECKRYEPKIANGELLSFSVHASVERRVEGKGYDPVARVRHAEQLSWSDASHRVAMEWLTRQGEAHGFGLEVLADASYEPVSCVRPRDRRGISHAALRMSGTLKVIDSERFGRALICGIGRGRAWGLGLLLVRRI
jgi:CRISPR system Cascade subunit CasE